MPVLTRQARDVDSKDVTKEHMTHVLQQRVRYEFEMKLGDDRGNDKVLPSLPYNAPL